jgi:hypothetical protein
MGNPGPRRASYEHGPKIALFPDPKNNVIGLMEMTK